MLSEKKTRKFYLQSALSESSIKKRKLLGYNGSCDDDAEDSDMECEDRLILDFYAHNNYTLEEDHDDDEEED